MEEKEYLALLGSVTKVMKAEKVLKKEGIDFILMPSPRTIPSPCGLTIQLKEGVLTKAEKALEVNKLKMTHLYVKNGGGYTKIY